MIQSTDSGLYCPAGEFHIDPWRPVERAVTTHAHSDHARVGSQQYLCAESGLGVLRTRIGSDASIESIRFGESRRMGKVEVSLHPAGHLLGSAQVRIRHRKGGPIWVITGDFKVDADPTCEPFEPVQCDVFLTECTFGLPIFNWPDQRDVMASIHEWWRENQAEQASSVIFAYAMGKAQRLLGALDSSIGPIGVHGSVAQLNAPYQEAGIKLAEWRHASADTAAELKGRGLIIAPPSTDGSPWLRKFRGKGGMRTAMASGWMAIRGRRRWRNADRGFIISDHADWAQLLETIRATGASRIGVMHGYTSAFARYLCEQGQDAFEVSTRYEGESEDATSTDERQAGEVAS